MVLWAIFANQTPVVLVQKELLGKKLWILANGQTRHWARHIKLALTLGQRSIGQILIELVGNFQSVLNLCGLILAF